MMVNYCMGKRIYNTIEEALQTAQHQIEHNNAPNLQAYQCGACMGWHLTKSKKKGKK